MLRYDCWFKCPSLIFYALCWKLKISFSIFFSNIMYTKHDAMRINVKQNPKIKENQPSVGATSLNAKLIIIFIMISDFLSPIH